MFEGLTVPIVLTGLFINEDYSMPFTAADLKRLIREELTATDKTDIERMIRKQLNSDLDPAVEKAVTKAVKAEVQAAIGDKSTQKEMADISKKIIKKLYKDLSMHHPYIIDRIKI
tara:strand:+ start:3109 stop:3453 length:345 start_codon:yes stop_codon:yes gene_type:complete